MLPEEKSTVISLCNWQWYLGICCEDWTH